MPADCSDAYRWVADKMFRTLGRPLICPLTGSAGLSWHRSPPARLQPVIDRGVVERLQCKTNKR